MYLPQCQTRFWGVEHVFCMLRGSRARLSEFKSQCCHLLALCLWPYPQFFCLKIGDLRDLTNVKCLERNFFQYRCAVTKCAHLPAPGPPPDLLGAANAVLCSPLPSAPGRMPSTVNTYCLVSVCSEISTCICTDANFNILFEPKANVFVLFTKCTYNTSQFCNWTSPYPLLCY